MSTTVPQPDVVSVERVIPAPPEKIFDLLADPSRHQDIDGSGSVRDAKNPSGRVALGTTFGMSMKRGIGYSTQNTVIEFEENRRIAWQTSSGGRLGKMIGGVIWRYELEPVDGGTRVRESWDISQARGKAMIKRAGKQTRTNIEQTLARIEELVTA